MAADLAHVPLASLRSMVVEIYQAWAQTDTGKAASGADGISAHLSSSEYDALLVKITELKELVQRQHGEGAQVVRQQRVQQRQQQQQRAQHPKGFRMGQHKAPPVGFDRDDQRAKPFCGRCRKAGKGESYHFYRDCPLGGRQHPPTSAAAFCIPTIDEEDAEGRQLEEYESSETEDESEYPVGYFDDTDDSCEVEEEHYGHLAAPNFSSDRLEQEFELGTDREEFENENFPEAAFAEGEELDDGYTAEEWAAWDAGAYDSHEYGGASEEFTEHFDEYVDDDTLFQQAADDGAESFARAAAAYGPPAVLCAGAVGGIDVSAYGFAVEQQSASVEPVGDDILRRLDDLAAEVHSAANHQVHFTHASFPPPDGIEQQASALVCGPAAAGTTPEEQVPAGGAAASASAVPAPAMPVSQGKDVKPAPLQSARVTATADADGEFAGFVQTVNHAAIGQVDLTGYDTDEGTTRTSPTAASS
ncbi:hypothetical protein CYMTET_4129 [Cymbomonas tetramitiformis]|uniref:Uncharacterized protein n=1 Tax=Cymbomonas tetramitiformis TaxID=36881 RepID=A0AAE0LKT4_9CHLO|nr:hypothetical protein CYMTET_4129 [Cymbomonas tetramitiformis]